MIKPAEIDVPIEDPFECDALSRRETIEKLTGFLRHLSEPFVLSLNSPWGTGKTTFVRMWNQYLRNEGFNTLSFNAWETDFAEDPFLALVEELRAEISNLTEDPSDTGKFNRQLRQNAIEIAKKGIPLLLRVVARGVLNLDEKIEDEIAGLVSGIAEERVDEYLKTKNSIEGFKETLAQLVDSLTPEDGPATPMAFACALALLWRKFFY